MRARIPRCATRTIEAWSQRAWTILCHRFELLPCRALVVVAQYGDDNIRRRGGTRGVPLNLSDTVQALGRFDPKKRVSRANASTHARWDALAALMDSVLWSVLARRAGLVGKAVARLGQDVRRGQTQGQTQAPIHAFTV
jgi:hypothetical protein